MRRVLCGAAFFLCGLGSITRGQVFVSGDFVVTGSSQRDINENGQIDEGESQNANAKFTALSGSKKVSGSGGTSTGGVFATMNFETEVIPLSKKAGQQQYRLTFSALGTALCPTTSSAAFASLDCSSNVDNVPITLQFGGTENYTYVIEETERVNVRSFNFVDATTKNAVSGGTFAPGLYSFDYGSSMFVSSTTPGVQTRMVWAMTITQLPSPTQLPWLAMALLGVPRKRKP